MACMICFVTMSSQKKQNSGLLLVMRSEAVAKPLGLLGGVHDQRVEDFDREKSFCEKHCRNPSSVAFISLTCTQSRRRRMASGLVDMLARIKGYRVKFAGPWETVMELQKHVIERPGNLHLASL